MLRRSTPPAFALAILLAASGGGPLEAGQETPPRADLPNIVDPALAAKAASLFERVPAPVRHYEDLDEARVRARLADEESHREVLREKLEDRWFAALVATSQTGASPIQGRFETWRGLVEFLAERDAVVDVWAVGGEAGGPARRIPAFELAKLKRERHEQPTWITVTYRDPETGKVVHNRLEFSFGAAEAIAASNEAYGTHRRLHLISREILGARNAEGSPDAFAQWEAMHAARNQQRLEGLEPPSVPLDTNDLFVACEFEVDDRNNFRKLVRLYRDAEIRRSIVNDAQALVLQPDGGHEERRVFAYRRRGVSDELERVRSPLPGQDAIELRVEDPTQPDPRMWRVLEFGEPELLRQSALAHFSLVGAYLEKHRKTLAMKQADLALIVEPIIAGLNIGGGLAGVPFPLGAAARLAYNALVVPWLIADVPSVKQMRDLFRLLTAKAAHPVLRTKPPHLLDRGDLKVLREALKDLTDADVADYLRRMSQEDLKAMLRIARMQRIDARLVNLLSIVAEAGRVSGWTDESGWQREVFNNIYFSVTGEISINYIIAALAGAKNATPHSGVSLQDLSRGDGPAEAWLQYLNVTVDFRAVVNTVVRLTQRGLANKELKQPFPYAPRMDDLAAYEIRVFGYPLLMFYKRGLLRADVEAFENDYAYGLLGTRIVERFHTREAFEAEIRAGRVVPLGYVRVPSGKGGWKETNLAVFAHRVPSGRHQGKTALILYGLKAYREHSELVERERKRFLEFESGLREGAVIEQCVAAEPDPDTVAAPAFVGPVSPAGLDAHQQAILRELLHGKLAGPDARAGQPLSPPARTFEPVIHAGPSAGEEIYEALLGNLLELRRHELLETWGLPRDEREHEAIRAIRDRLANQGIEVPEGNPLEGVDAFNSSFIYRRQVDGWQQQIRVTRIPSLADIDRELGKADEARQIEAIRREAVSGKSTGVILLNEALEIGGRLEIGPLLRDDQGQALGTGVTSGAGTMADIFDLIDRLPVVDRARLRFNRFAATAVDLDLDGDGVPTRVFLTIEFPLGTVRRDWINPLSGEPETLVFVDGQWRESLTDRRILELNFDAAGTETGSRTYRNRGDRGAPERGELIEETRTLDVWFRDLGRADPDPYLPLLSKLRFHYVTGLVTRETYGLFPLPVEVADDRHVTRSRYTPHGLFHSAQVFENGRSDADFERPLMERVLNPVVGRERFRLASIGPEPEAQQAAPAAGDRIRLERTDLVTGSIRIETIDPAGFGRKIEERYVDPFDGARSFATVVTLEYDDQAHHGLIPVRTVTRSDPSGVQLAEVTTLSYDPLDRRLTAVELDYTGKVRTNTWDARWTNPVEIQTAQRRTVIEYSRDETRIQGAASLQSTGETVETFTGQHDPVTGTFRTTRFVWHRPDMLSRTETNVYSVHGKLISTRVGDTFEGIVQYAADGQEQARQTFRRDPATGRFDIPHREEDDYQWRAGERNARVRTWLEGAPYDEYRIQSDAEGRLLIDQIHSRPQLELQTLLTYEGDSPRMLEAQVLQNGQVRATHRARGEVLQPDGTWGWQVEVAPFWGLTHTHRYLLGDPLGRPVATEFENGDRARTIEWFADTAIAKVSERIDRQGRPRERWVRFPNAGMTEGLPYDRMTRRELSPWGDEAFKEDKAVLRGADVSLFQETAEARVHFDLGQPYESPLWTDDPRGHLGIQAAVAGTSRSNVTAVFKSRFRDWQDPVATNRPPERVLEQTRVDLLTLFRHRITKRISDRMGAVIEEQTGKIADPGTRVDLENTAFDEAAGAPADRTFAYRYEAGWLAEQVDPKNDRRWVAFTQTPPPQTRAWRVNESGWREWPTEVEGRQTAGDSPSAAAGAGPFVFRRLHDARILRENPYLPGVTNVWTAWAGDERNTAGQRLFETETIFDARGDAITTVAFKRNSRDHPATKIAYQLPAPVSGTWPVVAATPGGGLRRLNPEGPTDLSACDFIAFYLDGPGSPRVELHFRDAAGANVSVAAAGDADNAVIFWPVNQGRVQWLPQEWMPERGSEVAAPAAWVRENKVFVVSVPELARAGLDVGRLAAIDLAVERETEEPVRISPLYRLAHMGRPLLPKSPRRFPDRQQPHSGGLLSIVRTGTRPARDDLRSPGDKRVLLQYNGITVATVVPSYHAPHYPIIRFIDPADPDVPLPLYALAAYDGQFLESYRTVAIGDAHVYTLASGFTTPKLEIFRAAVLDDEIAPGVLAFGRDYDIRLPLSKGGGGLSTALADLHNRFVASVFILAQQRFIDRLFGTGSGPADFLAPAPGIEAAAARAGAIDQLPMLAQVLLPNRPVPWEPAAPEDPVARDPAGDTNAWRVYLGQLSTRYPETGLIPTAPDTDVERYVDTVESAAIIGLAVELNELSIARELLAFYWEKSQGGTNRLLASYDAKTGASLVKEPSYERPSDARATARAQLAMADAAFRLGVAAGDPNALAFGVNLVRLVLDEFQPKVGDIPWPRGIAEYSARGTITRQGVTLWPEARSFSLESNARAYLLFSRIEELLDRHPFEADWSRAVVQAAREQAAWLSQRILPHVQRTGVAPKGLFEIQEVHTRTRALAAERWTAAEDWLTFLEAADRMGVSRDLTRSWLENLARVHGVTVRGIWGLDWSVAFERPDAISPALTAKFLRVATLLGHLQAAGFARQNLELLRQGERWPVVATTAATNRVLPTGQGTVVHPANGARSNDAPLSAGSGWPETPVVYAQLTSASWPAERPSATLLEPRPAGERDITEFFWTVAAFYLAIVATALFWWGFRAARRRRKAALPPSHSLVSDTVLRKAEERWAKRVLGLRVPKGAEHSRYSNGAVEPNFHMQLRAVYKLVLEWRRVVHGWAEDDERLVEDGADEWLNGMDEFAVMVGIYSRWVVKAGRKDGCRKPEVLDESEDSNHLWSRLVMYFSESHLALLGSIKEFKAQPRAAAVLGLNDQIELALRTLGVRARKNAFDARTAFDVPDRAEAFDLLVVQLPGATLPRIAGAMEERLGIPRRHLTAFVKGFKSFKERENLYPIHPYLFELAKVLPHFILMGLMGLIWYNHELGGLRIYPYLKELAIGMALDWRGSSIWAVPLLTGAALSLTAYFLEIYRHRWRSRSPAKSHMALEADLSSLFARATQTATPAIRIGRGWNPLRYRHAGWVFRAVGLLLLIATLLRLEPPSFATFMFVKGLVVVLLLAEAGGILVPIVVSRFSMWLEDRTASNPNAGAISRFVNQLNLVPTRPASLIWLSLRYHFQPSVPTGGVLPMIQAIVVYLLLGAVFFLAGGYMFKQALEVWFQETYRHGRDLGLVVGGFLFWITMYLLRFGLFVLLVAVSSALVRYPFRTLAGLAACGSLVLYGLDRPLVASSVPASLLTAIGLALGLVLIIFEPEALAWLKQLPLFRRHAARKAAREQRAIEQRRVDPDRALGVVYMSGDDLSFYKLTSDLLMARLQVLRDQLGSPGLRLLASMHGLPDDAALAVRFRDLHELERRHDTTLWHPRQLVLPGEPGGFRPELGLNLVVADAAQREQVLATWHIRRWLVTMMSTAGHAQDTGINLVDIALRLAKDGLGPHTVFYLIQNKYDNQDNNRPSQLPYDQGELGQRNKLARLLEEAAPGSRAYSLNDWTPFGFKAGGLVGMDLVHEESLKLTNMLVLDRNANAHDLDAVMADLTLALSNPGAIIVIPGRSTTNTLTPIGQGSQLIEEGQRALTRGVMLLGGTGAETLGTGWGNIQAVYYGRVQKALCDPDTSMLPLTTPGRRGAAFGERFEGLIGFGPHAVGISEDIWGVTQAAHNALALGYQVTFHRSRTLWHKLRESWSHAEWFSAFPRWAGGYLQMLLDPIMQRINDDGPLPVFAKELRASGGRFFLSAPVALLSILLMPLAIILDMSPFVQILILLWNLGFLMNQVLTALGLVACIESTGFNRGMAAAGTALAALLIAGVEGSAPLAPALLGLGCLAGGFAMGIGRWLYYRGRDVMLFGPQLVIHTLGQVVRQSLEFVLSGASANDARTVNIAFRAWAGPREDRPTEGYQNCVNLRTVVWGVGVVSFGLNLFALAQLDFLNVLLLLPSLMFSVSTLVGPFLMHPKPGRDLGKTVWIPKLLGWTASFCFYGLVAWLVARGGWVSWIGLLLFAACFGWVLFSSLRYLGYHSRLGRLTRRLADRITDDSIKPAQALALAGRIVRGLGGDAGKTRTALQQAGLPAPRLEAEVDWVQQRVLPVLQQPVTDLRNRRWANSRFACEFDRSFVLALFTFVWFFIVPVPGLLVFTAPDNYRITLPLAGLLAFAGCFLGAVMAWGCVSLLLEWIETRGLAGKGLLPRIEAQYRRFQSLSRSPGGVSSLQLASLYALFTDAQTHVDQRSYAYARQTLDLIQQTLDAATSPADRSPN